MGAVRAAERDLSPREREIRARPGPAEEAPSAASEEPRLPTAEEIEARVREAEPGPGPPMGPPDDGLSDHELRTRSGPPIVTVFGAGIAGLTAAHELVERGCVVQVVEARKDVENEFGVEVGGLATTQFWTVRAPLERLHPLLFPAEGRDYRDAVDGFLIVDDHVAQVVDERGEPYELDDEQRRALDALRRLRDLPFQPTQRPVDISFNVDFAPLGEVLDPGRHEYGREEYLSNGEKLERVAGRLIRAFADFARQLVDDVCEAEKRCGQRLLESLPLETLRRELVLVEIRGHAHEVHADDGTIRDARAISHARGMVVRDALVDRIREIVEDPPDILRDDVQRLRELLYDLIPPDGRRSAVDRFLEDLAHHFVVRAMGSTQPLGDAGSPTDSLRSERVELALVQSWLPGDHGYRYFPAYYRHLFDTMRRTPLLDAAGDETGQTAFDQLVSPPEVAIAVRGWERPRQIKRTRTESLEGLRKMLELFVEDLGIPMRDMQLFFLSVFKFMTSCSERRHEECEHLSWLEYIDGRSEHRVGSIEGETHYGEVSERLIRESSQALVAMDAEETDALTHAVNMVQLMLDQLGTGAQTDMTLNGPTSPVWLEPWKRYLRSQGVRFFRGELAEFVEDEDGSLFPLAVGPYAASGPLSHTPLPEDARYPYIGHSAGGEIVPLREELPDFYVMALSYHRGAFLVQDHERIPDNPPLDGDLAALARFDREFVERDRLGHDIVQQWSPRGSCPGRAPTGLPLRRWLYPMRDLSGIQLFFPNQVRIGAGHVVYQDTPWGLTSISQVAHWRERTSRVDGYVGQVSVDIGDFYEPHEMEAGRVALVDVPRILDLPGELLRPKTAWQSSIQEIPVRVWDQILETLGPDYANVVEPPRYYHLDAGIHARGFRDEATWMHRGRQRSERRLYPAWNATPFFINLPGQFLWRPGLVQTDAAHLPRPDDPRHEIRYRVSNGRWVLAGTHMATHTRLTTMESANESARHAVNAIIDAILHDEEGRYRSSGRLIGDPCEIWPPYEHEIEDLEPLRRLDRSLWEEGIPHVVDVLGVRRFVERMPVADPRARPIDDLSRALGLAGEQRRRDWQFATPRMPTEDQIRQMVGDGTERLLDLLDTTGTLSLLRDFLERLLDGAGEPGEDR